MLSFWNAAIAICGLAGVAAFVFLSLYQGWIRLDIFAQLTRRQTFALMMTFLVLSFLAVIAILVVAVIDYGPVPKKATDTRAETAELELQGTLDIRDPTIDASEVSIGLLWQIEDDRSYYWTDGVLLGTTVSVAITKSEPPEDALMFISPVESSTPSRRDLLRLGVALLIAYRDENSSGLFDRGDELLGGCPTHVVTFRDGPMPRDLEWELPEGYAVAVAISPEEHGLEADFDVLRSVQSSTRLQVVIPQSRDEIRFPDWT